MTKVILPGARLGVLGSGQLGRMFALEARAMGYRVHTYSPDRDTPTGQVADVEVTGDYHDLDQVRNFAQGVDVITFEFENVPAETAAACAEYAPVRPAGMVLHTCQHRLREKQFLRDSGFPATPFRAVRSKADLVTALNELGYPAVLKTAHFGYDGKGQVKIIAPGQIHEAWESLGGVEGILEAFIDFDKEISVVAARGTDGNMVFYDVFENHHRRHILDLTMAPARISEDLARQARDIAAGILESLDVIGVLCVEFFVTRDGKILVNELAPRPHNSGHLTLDCCVTSQFEQQVRAVCGLPLGSTRLLRPSAMANLLGDLWANGTPNWAAAWAIPGVKLHLYGKSAARPGRKMGHLTVSAATVQVAAARAMAARDALLKP